MKPCRRHKHASTISQIDRRSFLGALAAGGAAAGLSGCGQSGPQTGESAAAPVAARSQSQIAPLSDKLAMPGPFPGRVVEVGHAGSVTQGKRDRAAVRAMMEWGMKELVPGAQSAVDAWRYFFQKGDRVGIKVVPVGKVARPGASGDGPIVDLERPGSISSYEVVAEVVEALKAAGIRANDILVFERYRTEFIQAGYVARLPEGVHWECSSAAYDNAQLEIDGQIRGQDRKDHVAGYDRDVFREMAYCQPPSIHDPNDDRRFRSHLAKIVTQKVDKFISIPVLKDHRSAGVTLALKNLSHGLVNNVARSHIALPGYAASDRGGTLNQCHEFIPAAVSLGPTRAKAVLQILDGLVATYEGGPGNWNRTFATWEHKSLFFATDPVALDHIGWQIIDAKRAEMGWPSVARMGFDSASGVKPEITDDAGKPFPEQFHIRQPQHVPLAALLGLGTFDKDKIQHRRIELA